MTAILRKLTLEKDSMSSMFFHVGNHTHNPPTNTNLFMGVVLSVRIKMASDTEVLSDGHVETGQNCFDKALNLGRNGLIGGNCIGWA